jgi:hypothetical protein
LYVPLIGTVGYKGCVVVVDFDVGAVMLACGAEGTSGVASPGVRVLTSYDPIDVKLGKLLMLGTLVIEFMTPAVAGADELAGKRGIFRGGTRRGLISPGPIESFGPKLE